MSKDEMIRLRIESELKEAFSSCCRNNHEDMSDVLTRAIVEYVRNSPPPLNLRKIKKR